MNKTLFEDEEKAFNPNLAGVGCFGSDNKAVLYKKLYMERNSYIADSFPINDLIIDFQVRNAADPLITALVLTDQSLNFGMSSSDLIITGILLLFVSVVCAIAPIQHLKGLGFVPDYRNLKSNDIDV